MQMNLLDAASFIFEITNEVIPSSTLKKENVPPYFENQVYYDDNIIIEIKPCSVAYEYISSFMFTIAIYERIDKERQIFFHFNADSPLSLNDIEETIIKYVSDSPTIETLIVIISEFLTKKGSPLIYENE